LFIRLSVLDADSYNTTPAAVSADEVSYIRRYPTHTLVLLKCGVEWEVTETVDEIVAQLRSAVVS
jgi:hypothetical protein